MEREREKSSATMF